MCFLEIRPWKCARPRSKPESIGLAWEVSSNKQSEHNERNKSGVIYARAHLGHPIRVESLRHFRRHLGEHKVELTADRLPYKTTYMLPILHLRKIKRVLYKHPRGAITIVRFRPLSDGSVAVQR